MDIRVDYVGFFPTQTADAAWEAAASHAKRFDLLPNQIHQTQVSYGGRDPQPQIVLRRHDSEWSNFGVFTLRPEFLDAVGAGEIIPWLLTIADDLKSCFARSFYDETVPTRA